MIKQDWMIIIAGNAVVDAMEVEQKATVPFNGYGYESEALCRLQSRQASRGIIGVEIVKSMHGYSVRYDSGLQNFGLLAHAQDLGGTLEGAETFVKTWVEQDQSRRYAWRRK